MSLDNVHEWVDQEVIIADDLNSIAVGIAEELNAGSIPASKLVWPLVAQGNIDMNGYDLRNFGSLLGVIHVNDEKTLAQAITEAGDGDTIVIDPGATAVATASNITITGRNGLSILGYGVSEVSIGNAVTTAGITIDNTCNNITISGIKFTGGTVAKPAIYLSGSSNSNVLNNYFTTYEGVKLGNGSTTVLGASVDYNVFSSCDKGIYGYALKGCSLKGNRFVSCAKGIALPSDTEGECSYNYIAYNRFRQIGTGGCIAASWTGSISATRGLNRIEFNTIEPTSTYSNISMVGYFNDNYIGNTCGGPCAFSGTALVIKDNVFVSTMSIGGTLNTLDGNVIRGAFSRTSTGGSDNLVIINNTFHTAYTFANNGLHLLTSNTFYAGFTVSTAPNYNTYSHNAGAAI